MTPSARQFGSALRQLRRLGSGDDWVLRPDRGCDFPEFIARLQDDLEAIANAEFWSGVGRVMLKVASALRVEGD